MKIEVWSDFACPFCYIGKKKFENALAKFAHKDQVEVIYKAYQLNPNAPKEMTSNAYEAFASGHNVSVEQAKQRFDMFTKSALEVGLEYRYDKIQMTNTFDAHRIAKWANKTNQETLVTTRFMKAYFTDGLNLASHQVLLDLVSELGLDVEGARKVLKSDAYKKDVLGQIQEGRSIGVQGVPFFVLGRKYGVSGAQGEDYFLNALNQLWQETKPLEQMPQQADASCAEDDCGI